MHKLSRCVWICMYPLEVELLTCRGCRAACFLTVCGRGAALGEGPCVGERLWWDLAASGVWRGRHPPVVDSQGPSGRDRVPLSHITTRLGLLHSSLSRIFFFRYTRMSLSYLLYLDDPFSVLAIWRTVGQFNCEKCFTRVNIKDFCILKCFFLISIDKSTDSWV